MRGYPKHLNTKADYLYVIEQFPKEDWKKDLQDLIDSSKDWITTGEVESVAKGKTDKTHRVLEETDEESKTTKYLQQELQEIPTAKIFKLGFTIKEVQSYLA